MNALLRVALLVLAIFALIPALPVRAEEKAPVSLTDKAPGEWILKEAKTGARIVSDRDYAFTELPKEIEGGTLLLRDTGKYKFWLAPLTLTASKDGTVYAIFLWKARGKEQVGEVTLAKLEREGWKEVKEPVETTFPAGEDWKWKTFKKEMKKGNVNIPLRTLDWGRLTPVLFVFK